MKYFQLIFAALFIFCGDVVVFAQEEENKGLVRGIVKEKSTQLNIEFATVSLFRTNDSTLVTGGITLNSGSFEIPKVPNGNYYVKVDFIGFEPTYFNNITISNEKSEIDLGEINLASYSKNMDQFEFVDEKELMEVKIDKKIYNVSKDIGVQGGTGLDVLKNMPSVDVDDQDKISLRGDQSVQVLIDGRPSTIDASQLLKQIPASSIERIEVVTNPSAKYNPEGMSGILNVIMKKENARGMNGNVGLGYSYNSDPGYNGNLGLNFRKNKININTNFGYHQGVWSYSGVSDRNYFSDTAYTQTMTDFGFNKNKNLWYSGGLDYYMNKKNTLYMEVSGWSGSGDRFDNNHYDYFDEAKIKQSYSDRIANTGDYYRGNDMNVGWQTQFDSEEHTLDVDVDYEINTDDGDNDNNEHFYLSNGVEYKNPRAQNTRTKNKNSELDIKADYVLPINDSLTLELGSRTTVEYIDNDFYSESLNSFNVFRNDTNLSNVFFYEQSVYAFYATIGKQYKKLGVKLGSRLENTIINTELQNTKQKSNQNYLSLFPSLHFSYKFNEKNEVQLSYSRRINRPNTWEVNPFASYTDPYNLWQGNPNLKPEFIDVYELGYLRFGEKINFNSSIYFRQVNGQKQSITYLNENNIFVTSNQNLSTTFIYGGEASVDYKAKKWLKINNTYNLWTANINGASSNSTAQTYGWSTQLTSNVTLNKEWSFQLRGQYTGAQVTYQNKTESRYGLNASISKTMWKEKGRITLRVNDIFKTQRWANVSNNLGGFSYQNDRRWSSQSINISFNYNFGKINYDSQKRDTKNNSAGDNLNIGGGGAGQGK
ncbi:MAG: TonB-dependent receptor [Flavobacteriales bacterium]